MSLEFVPRLAVVGEVVRTEGLELRREAARLANEAAGVNLYQIVVPEDQTFQGDPVPHGTTRILLTGEWIEDSSFDTGPYRDTLAGLRAEQ